MHVLFHVCPLCMWRQLKSCMGMVDSATTADKTAQRCPAQKAAELTDQMQTTANSRMFYFHFSTQKFYCVLTSDKPSLVSLALVSTQGFFSFWIPANNENYCKKKTLLLNKNTWAQLGVSAAGPRTRRWPPKVAPLSWGRVMCQVPGLVRPASERRLWQRCLSWEG